MNSHGANLRVRHGRNAINRNTVVDDGVVVADDVIVYDGRVVVNVCDASSRSAIAIRPRIAKTIERHEREAVGAQAKTEAESHGTIMVSETNSRTVTGARWQRRPSAIID